MVTVEPYSAAYLETELRLPATFEVKRPKLKPPRRVLETGLSFSEGQFSDEMVSNELVSEELFSNELVSEELSLGLLFHEELSCRFGNSSEALPVSSAVASESFPGSISEAKSVPEYANRLAGTEDSTF